MDFFKTDLLSRREQLKSIEGYMPGTKTEIIGLSSTNDVIASKAIEFGEEKRKIRARRSRSFKVIEVGINQNPVCDLILVINRYPISCRFGVIAAYCSNFGHCVFEHPFGSLTDNVRCSSWAHSKTRSGLPISVNLSFFARSYSDALRAKIDRKSAISLQRGQFDPKFHAEGSSHQSFLHG